MSSITDGIYKILNVAYPSQVADLLSPGGADGIIGGYADSDSSKRNQWAVTNDAVGGQITLTNQAITTYAYTDESSIIRTLVGNPDVPLVWTVSPTDVEDQFLIVMVDSPIAWTLADGDDGTPITVEPIGVPTQDNQLWQFLAVN